MAISFGARRLGATLRMLCAATLTMAALGCEGDELGTGSNTTNPFGLNGNGGNGGDSTASTTSTLPGSDAGAGTSGAGPTGTQKPSCDVQAIFEAECVTCHAEEPIAGAPMPLVDYEDFQGMGVLTPDQTILSLIGTRIHDPQKPMPPSGGLSDEDKAAIDAWLAAGAPADDGLGCGGGTDADGGAGKDTGGSGTTGDSAGTNGDSYTKAWPPPDADECFEFRAHGAGGPDSPYMVGAGEEIHPKITFDAPWGDKRAQAVGFRPLTGNAKVLHHWILYEDAGLFGAFLTGWAPGNEGRELEPDVGMYLPSGPQSMYLDMHYYNVAGSSDEPDDSGVEVCVAYEGNMRPNTATVFMDFSNIRFTLPAQEETDVVDYCQVSGVQSVTAMHVSPHMHELGYHAKLEVKRAGSGQVEVWHDAGFAFEDQQIYSLDGKQLHPGDVVKTTCSYRNDTSEPVTFGEDTGDEMCFNFVTYYPKGGLSCAPFYLGEQF